MMHLEKRQVATAKERTNCGEIGAHLHIQVQLCALYMYSAWMCLRKSQKRAQLVL